MGPILAILSAPTALVLGGVTPQPDGWLLQTDDTAVYLAAHNTAPVVRSLRAPGSDHEWAAGDMPIALPESILTDGEWAAAEWEYSGAAVDNAAGTVTLAYRCPGHRLALRSVWRARPGHGPVEHWMLIENRSPGVVTLASHPSLGLSQLHVPEGADVWWIRRGGGNASTQGGTYVEPVRPGLDLNLISTPTDGASPVPWAAVQSGDAFGLYVGWEYSGVGEVAAHVSGDGRQMALAVGNRRDFVTDLPSGATFLVPTAFVGCYRGSIDDGAYCLHRFILEKLRPSVPRDYPDPTLAYNLYLDAGGANAREEDVLRCTRICGDLGFETFVPDAMWFPHVGDWRWDPARFPRGVTSVEQLVHASGMKLGLWMAWTNGGLSEDAGAMSVRRHPEWFNGDYPPDWQPGPFYGGNLCLACDEAREWAVAETQRIVRDFRLDYLKHDIGPIVTDCNKTTHRHHHGTDVGYWAAAGYYDVMDRLRAAFPKLVLENCSGGGHIKDFGVIQRTHYTVTTDTLSNLPDRQSIYDSTFAFPPLILQAYTYNNAYPVEGDDPGPFLWRSAMMSAWQIDPTDATRWTDEQRAEARREVGIYKQWVRPILQDVKVHHILPRPDGANWDGLFYWSPSLRKGALYVFRPASDESAKTIRLAGLKPYGRYFVWAEDGSIAPGRRSGAELMGEGLSIRLPARYSCDLIYVQGELGTEPFSQAFAPPGSSPWGQKGSVPVFEALEPPGAFALADAQADADPFAAAVTLRWSPSRNARSYRVTVSENVDLSAPVVDQAVALPSVGCSRLEPGRTYYWTVTAAGWGGTRVGEPAVVPFTARELQPTPGVTFLSTIDWLSANAGADNPVRRDRNYYGHVPTIGGKRMPRALWTHSFADGTPADIVFDVSAFAGAEFRADVGLDDESHGGSVQFQVLLDGAVVAESAVLRQSQRHAFALPLGGARRLTLRVLNGGDGFACDHAVWGVPRIVTPGADDPCR